LERQVLDRDDIIEALAGVVDLDGRWKRPWRRAGFERRCAHAYLCAVT